MGHFRHLYYVFACSSPRKLIEVVLDRLFYINGSSVRELRNQKIQRAVVLK